MLLHGSETYLPALLTRHLEEWFATVATISSLSDQEDCNSVSVERSHSLLMMRFGCSTNQIPFLLPTN